MGKKFDELKERYTWKSFENPPPENGFYAVREFPVCVPEIGYYSNGKFYAAGLVIIYPSEWCYLPMEREE